MELRWQLLPNDLLRLLSLALLAAANCVLDVDEVVLRSDASEPGGGVCASTALTTLGLGRLGEAEALRAGPPADDLPLLDAFAGISAARRAFQLLGISPGTQGSMEVDAAANDVVSASF